MATFAATPAPWMSADYVRKALCLKAHRPDPEDDDPSYLYDPCADPHDPKAPTEETLWNAIQIASEFFTEHSHGTRHPATLRQDIIRLPVGGGAGTVIRLPEPATQIVDVALRGECDCAIHQVCCYCRRGDDRVVLGCGCSGGSLPSGLTGSIGCCSRTGVEALVTYWTDNTLTASDIRAFLAYVKNLLDPSTPDPGCDIPATTTSVTRQGVSWGLDPTTGTANPAAAPGVTANGSPARRTGIPEVDAWLASPSVVASAPPTRMRLTDPLVGGVFVRSFVINVADPVPSSPRALFAT